MFSFKGFEKRQGIAIFFMVGSFLSIVLVKLYIRPYFFRYNINDFGVTGSLPNFFAALGTSFFPLLLRDLFPFKKFKAVCISIAVGIVVYEFEQWFSGGGVFDPLDIAASVAGAMLAFYFCKWYVFSEE
jgi:hypothetical protein